MFTVARAVFLDGLHRHPDVQAGFYLPFVAGPTPGPVLLRCAAATFYRAYLNGIFVAHGPARAAHGMVRVDEIDLTASPAFIHGGENHLAIEVAGYGLDCIYTTGDASFVRAEIVAGDRVLAATDAACRGVRLTQRLAAERFSHARCAGEVYRLDAAFFDWRVGRIEPARAHAVAPVNGPAGLLPRSVPLPDYHFDASPRVIGVHTHVNDPTAVVPPIEPLEHGTYLTYAAALDEHPATECARERAIPLRGMATAGPQALIAFTALTAPVGVDLDFGAVKAGFLCIEIDTPTAAVVDLVFVDHLDESGGIDPRRGAMNGVIRLHLLGGPVRFQAFEPHCLRYVRVVVRETTTATVHQVGVIDYAYPEQSGGTFLCSDGDLNCIYDAARLTLRLNTQDVFMDCPGRERAGWLCDSMFSGRAMHTLFGDTSVERAMLENFLHAPQSDTSPGYFPECYPGRQISGGNFIPNWSMFLGIELADYVCRTGDVALRDAFARRIEQLVAGIERSTSTHRLLENLPGFTFIDWSDANRDDFKRPISTATNALYALMLDELGTLYSRNDWRDRAEEIRTSLRRHMPADGPLPDALRTEGDALSPGDRASEAAAYYLYWTGAADAERLHAANFNTLIAEYGPAPDRPPRGTPLAPSNVFIGLYLRLELLARHGEHERLVREMRALFLPMLARGPGTLWENLKPDGSVCHGFASYAAVWLTRDLLGIGIPDARTRTITIAPSRAGLAWARGTVLIDNQPLTIDWHSSNTAFALTATVPDGYTAVFKLPPALRATGRVCVNGIPSEKALNEVTFEHAIEIEWSPARDDCVIEQRKT